MGPRCSPARQVWRLRRRGERGFRFAWAATFVVFLVVDKIESELTCSVCWCQIPLSYSWPALCQAALGSALLACVGRAAGRARKEERRRVS